MHLVVRKDPLANPALHTHDKVKPQAFGFVLLDLLDASHCFELGGPSLRAEAGLRSLERALSKSMSLALQLRPSWVPSNHSCRCHPTWEGEQRSDSLCSTAHPPPCQTDGTDASLCCNQLPIAGVARAFSCSGGADGAPAEWNLPCTARRGSSCGHDHTSFCSGWND